jgi:hypothetical protein
MAAANPGIRVLKSTIASRQGSLRIEPLRNGNSAGGGLEAVRMSEKRLASFEHEEHPAAPLLQQTLDIRL